MSHFQYILLHICLFLTPYILQAQPVPRSEVDSLRKILQTSQPDTNRVKIWIRLSEHQVYKPGEFQADMDSARTYAQQAQRLSQKLGYYRGEARSHNLLGTISKESKEFSQAIAYQQAAIKLFKRHKDVTGEVNSFLLLAQAIKDSGDARGARKEVQKAIAICTKRGSLQLTAHAYLELGNTFANWGEELNEKIKNYQQALQLFAQEGNKKKQADVHKDLGDLYQLQGSNAQALLELRKALGFYRSINYPFLQGVYDLLGELSTEMGDYQEGLRYGLQAVETAESLQDTTLQMCAIYNHLGITYYNIKQHQKAHVYFKKAMHIAHKYNDAPSIIFLTGNIATVLMKLGQTEASTRLLLSTAKQYPPQSSRDSIFLAAHLLLNHTQLKQFMTASRYYDQLLAFSSRLGKNDDNFKHIYTTIIPFLITSKQHEQARKYLAAFEEFSTTTNYLRGASVTQLYWFQLDSMQANYPSAIRHYQQYKLLQDSLFTETKSRQIASLEVLYETERKEKDLQLKEQSIEALTKEKQLQVEKMKKDRLIRNGIIGGAVLLLLLLGVIYNRYRLKQRSNKLLQAQQHQLQAQHEELQTQQDKLQVQQQQIYHKNQTLEQLLVEKERLLKEIHHRVKNNLQIVMSLLNSQAASLEDKAALSAIQESQNRVQAMALIHQKLYQAEGVARIPINAYIEEVVAYLRDSYTLSQRVSFQLDIEQLELDVTLAVPLGLIINEAITNTLKYAFPGDRSGTVSLRLHQQSDAIYELTIEDNGVGLPVNYDPSQSRSLGMTLIHGFSAQLGGELYIENRGGVKLTLVFADEQLNPIHNKADYVY